MADRVSEWRSRAVGAGRFSALCVRARGSRCDLPARVRVRIGLAADMRKHGARGSPAVCGRAHCRLHSWRPVRQRFELIRAGARGSVSVAVARGRWRSPGLWPALPSRCSSAQICWPDLAQMVRGSRRFAVALEGRGRLVFGEVAAAPARNAAHLGCCRAPLVVHAARARSIAAPRWRLEEACLLAKGMVRVWSRCASVCCERVCPSVACGGPRWPMLSRFSVERLRRLSFLAGSRRV
jgi:hypothetical protein